ncbi:MAG: TetR/AcrR family transcriptional regulator [Candidatus Limnocylindrales bacterium]
MTLARPREAALHEAATRLFRQRGFHATSMQDLAEDLGMNRGSLYHYIEAKDDLLWAIVNGAMERLDGAVRPILEGPDPIPERLTRAIAAHLGFAAEHGDELALIQIELRALAPDRRETLVGQRDAYEAAWREAIRQGVADGSIRPVDVRLASIAILSVCNWFTQWYRPDGPLDVPAIGQEFAGLFLDGLLGSSR